MAEILEKTAVVCYHESGLSGNGGMVMETGRFVDLIHKKRMGGKLTKDQVRRMIDEYTSGKIPDYQMSAMLMAICFQGMDDEELTAMTLAMRDSGEVADLSAIPGIKVDKHSTGGVGDKTTLIVGPVVAACGIPVAKMSGRGLGFTGGTLDKLESVPGFKTGLETKEFIQTVKHTGISVIGQTGNLAPADRLLYALRDVTATVESIPLIAASIMSKKLASGSDRILLDVTTGSGAFIKDLKGSAELARRMTAIGNRAGKKTAAMITSMEEPLGFAVGNSLEVIEAVETLRGGGPEDLREVCLALSGMMLYLGEGASTYEEGRKRAGEVLENGMAYEKFCRMVSSQGGDTAYIENTELFENAPVQGEVKAGSEGWICSMNTEGIGIAAGILGAGREKKEDGIDPLAGIRMKKKIGDWVRTGDVLAYLYTSSPEKLEKAKESVKDSIWIGRNKPDKVKLIVDIIE